MPLPVYLTQLGGPAHKDTLSIKCEEITYSVKRSPLVYSLPGGIILGLELGRIGQDISLSVVVDENIDELFVTGITGGSGSLTVGFQLRGDAGWDGSVSPTRVSTPSATITGINVSAGAGSVFISGLLHGNADFFVDLETLTEYDGINPTGVHCHADKPLGTFHRWEQASAEFSKSGYALSLTTPNAIYTVLLKDISCERIAGQVGRLIGKFIFNKVA